MGGGGVKIGDKTTSRSRCTRGTSGNGATKGNGATRDACAGRWGAAVWPEERQRDNHPDERQERGVTRGDGATRCGGACRTRRGCHSRWNKLMST
jgi:hypothetical protein